MPARTDIRIETPRLSLYMPSSSEAPRVVDYFERNRAHLEPWDPPRPRIFYARAFWEEQLTRNRKEFQEDRSMRLFLTLRDEPGPIVGTCNFTNFVRGAFQACNLGYAIDASLQGRGLMREALQAAIDHLFTHVLMHRVMANYMPSNERSGRLLSSLGFVIEGYARDYLFINGRWSDHVLTALVNPSHPSPRDLT
jgi:ribosomal-protein-alanine N-acetyltransferase